MTDGIQLLRTFVGSIPLIALLTASCVAGGGGGADRYGGALSMKGKATGAFHLEKINGRHCLVTPDGHGFLSLGVVHIVAIAQKSKVDLFAKKYGRDWDKFSRAALANLRSWGYNSAGYGAPQPLRKMIPYMASSQLLPTSTYLPGSAFRYPDVFDPDMQRKVRNRIRFACTPEKGNPNLIGYYWTDTPQWDLKRARRKHKTDWVSSIRSLPATAPGKKRYVKFLSDRYGGKIGTLPKGYHVKAKSFDALLNETFKAVDWSDPKVAADDSAFLRLIARELYRTLGTETRKQLPGALIFGERYLMQDHPDEVLEEALPYIDALAIQPWGSKFDGAYFDRLHKKTGKAILICDHQCSFATPEHKKTMWTQLESEQAVGEAYVQYLRDACAKPYILGYHRCQYINRIGRYASVLKQGLLREDGTPYETTVRYTRKANLEALRTFADTK